MNTRPKGWTSGLSDIEREHLRWSNDMTFKNFVAWRSRKRGKYLHPRKRRAAGRVR